MLEMHNEKISYQFVSSKHFWIFFRVWGRGECKGNNTYLLSIDNYPLDKAWSMILIKTIFISPGEIVEIRWDTKGF